MGLRIVSESADQVDLNVKRVKLLSPSLPQTDAVQTLILAAIGSFNKMF